MIRRALLTLIAVALVATAAGCGSSGSSSGSGLGDALSYVPKDAPVVVAINTDPDGDQWQQINDLIGKFPFGGAVKGQAKSAFNARAGLDYDKDIKPLLGNDFVVALIAAPGGDDTPFVVAWKTGDEDAARKLLERDSTKAGSVDGADLYRTKSGDLTALKDGTIIGARTDGDLKAALARADGDDHMSEDDFNAALGDLDKDSLVRVAGNLQALIATSPNAALARKVPWVAALRTLGLTLSAESDGLEYAFDVKTEGDLTPEQLPLASGDQPAPVIRRAGEIGFGIRNPAQTIAFGQQVAQITDPAGYAKFKAQKEKANKELGIDIDKDVFGQLTGNAEVSVSLDGEVAVRADLKDPAAAEATLEKAAPRLEKLAKDKSLGLSTPKNGKGFYALAQANGKKVVFGVIGQSLVVATDAARAAQFAGESPTTVPGAKGSVVTASDARALVNAIAAKQGQGAAVQIVTGALGDLVGSVETETSGITGSVKLFVR